MGLTPDVAPGGLVQSAWGNEIRDRTIQHFATVAERNTWVDRPAGAVCITTDTGTMWQYTGTAWVNAAARGIIARGTHAGTVFATGTPDQVVATFPSLVGRFYEFHAWCTWSADAPDQTVQWQPEVNGVVLAFLRQTNPSSSGTTTTMTADVHLGYAPEITSAACTFVVHSGRTLGSSTIRPSQWVWSVADAGTSIGIPTL